MVVFSELDRELSQSVYRDVAEAVACAVVRRQASSPCVFVAAYAHRFGVDLTAHATHEGALRRLAAVATRECARDPELRDRVTERFGCWTAQSPSLEMLERITDAWSDLNDGEGLWIAECEVQEADEEREVRPVVRRIDGQHASGEDDDDDREDNREDDDVLQPDCLDDRRDG